MVLRYYKYTLNRDEYENNCVYIEVMVKWTLIYLGTKMDGVIFNRRPEFVYIIYLFLYL
jgi:hypothetical protein